MELSAQVELSINYVRNQVNCFATSTLSRCRSNNLHNGFVLISIALIILIASNQCRSLLLAFLGRLEIFFKLCSYLPGVLYLFLFSYFYTLLLQLNFLYYLLYTLFLLQHISFLLLFSLLKLNYLILLKFLSLFISLLLYLTCLGLLYFK